MRRWVLRCTGLQSWVDRRPLGGKWPKHRLHRQLTDVHTGAAISVADSALSLYPALDLRPGEREPYLHGSGSGNTGLSCGCRARQGVEGQRTHTQQHFCLVELNGV